MALLKRVLYAQAGVWGLVGLALAASPRIVVSTLFDQVPYPDYAWVRIAGAQAFVLALLEVLVGHRSDELWWWSWAFVVASGSLGVIAVLHALFGLPTGSSPVLWWVAGAVALGFTAALLWGLARTGQERPIL